MDKRVKGRSWEIEREERREERTIRESSEQNWERRHGREVEKKEE